VFQREKKTSSLKPTATKPGGPNLEGVGTLFRPTKKVRTGEGHENMKQPIGTRGSLGGDVRKNTGAPGREECGQRSAYTFNG